MRLRLTAGQAVFVHGWLAPKRTLSWADVQASPGMTLDFLLDARLPVAALHQLQPDPAAWIRLGRATLPDCPSMGAWGAHPVRDFGAELADLVELRWPVDVMLAVGLTYQDLVGIGLSFSNMRLFSWIRLLGWAQLGLRREHVRDVPEPVLVRLFGLTKMDVLRSLK